MEIRQFNKSIEGADDDMGHMKDLGKANDKWGFKCLDLRLQIILDTNFIN